jgi:hypothetical protein
MAVVTCGCGAQWDVGEEGQIRWLIKHNPKHPYHQPGKGVPADERRIRLMGLSQVVPEPETPAQPRGGSE